MSSITAIATGPDSWDFYSSERDVFLASGELNEFDSNKGVCSFQWQLSEFDGEEVEYSEIATFVASDVIFGRKLHQVKTAVYLHDAGGRAAFESAGFLVGREFGAGGKRAVRLTCDRYDLVRNLCEALMGEHLDLEVWKFGYDSAKKRLGACHWDDHRLTVSRYLVDLHSLDEIDQVMRHEIAHALAGSNAGHGPKWKKLATSIGYRHKKISGEQIGDATAKLIGTCPSGHKVYRHRRPKSVMSCSRCSGSFDRRYLITWASRQ
jgi:predicted SprT family Zn-dependent metalloprotease